MTRENKLALVVGFALILFIGILISDHFSVARNQASANLATQQIADPLGTRARDEPGLITLKALPPQPTAPLLQPGEPAVSPSQMTAIESMSPEQRSMIADAQGRQIPQQVEPVSASNSTDHRAAVSTITTQDGQPIQIKGFKPVDSETVINLADMRFHDVRGGESLFAICKQYYGDASLVKALASFNRMDDPAQVRAGRKLMIPPPETLGSKPKAGPSGTPALSPPTAAPTVVVDARSSKTQPAKTPAKPKTYTIKAGDSLSLIAQRVLGDREKWRDLHKLNRKVIDDPDDLKVGTVIRLLS